MSEKINYQAASNKAKEEKQLADNSKATVTDSSVKDTEQASKTAAKAKKSSPIIVKDCLLLNLRSKPSIDGSVLAKIPRASTVQIVSTPSDEWTEVEYNGKGGYVMTKYLSC